MTIVSSLTVLLAVVVSLAFSAVCFAAQPQHQHQQEEECGSVRGYDTYDSLPVQYSNATAGYPYGFVPTEENVMRQVEAMRTSAKAFTGGGAFFVLDEGWSDMRNKTGGSSSTGGGTGDRRDGKKTAGQFWWSLNEHAIPVPIKENFPRGFNYLAEQLADAGLRLGVWHIKGIPLQAVEANLPIKGTNCTARDIVVTHGTQRVCGWHTDVAIVNTSHPCGRAYYHSMFDAWVGEMNISYVKMDCVFGSDEIAVGQPLGFDEISVIAEAKHAAEVKHGRKVVLSLSPGFLATAEMATPLLKTHVNLWRATDDLWPGCWSPALESVWQPICLISNVCATVTTLAYFAEGGLMDRRNVAGAPIRPDPDMIGVGRTRLGGYGAWEEPWQRSANAGKLLTFMFALWTITLSPVILGGDLTYLAKSTTQQPAVGMLLNNMKLREMHCTGTRPRMLDYEPPVAFNASRAVGHTTWVLSKRQDKGMGSYLGFFVYSLDPTTTAPRTRSRLVTWAELGLIVGGAADGAVNGTQVPIPNISCYDVLKQQPCATPRYNPFVTKGIVVESDVNDAVVLELFGHE